jgi:cytochrome c oxidase subunit 1/cytochrome c oxidase subunit I+III
MYYWFPKVTGRMYHERWAQASFWVTFVGTLVTFFPMHIVGLLGMTRRVYTYQAQFGWDAYNLAETIGAFILTAGLLMIFANLAWSRFRGPPSGPDPFFGGTLEWATTSPPPHYNFAVIPTVSSPYPNWDREDRQEDVRRFERGFLVLESGHETPASTVRDAYLDEVVDMPSESAVPITLAFVVTVMFIMLLIGHYVIAAVLLGIAALVLAGWHAHEPEEA